MHRVLALQAAPGASASRSITLDVIAPPYPCAGIGELRVVRVLDTEGVIELTAAYPGYARL